MGFALWHVVDIVCNLMDYSGHNGANNGERPSDDN